MRVARWKHFSFLRGNSISNPQQGQPASQQLDNEHLVLLAISLTTTTRDPDRPRLLELENYWTYSVENEWKGNPMIYWLSSSCWVGVVHGKIRRPVSWHSISQILPADFSTPSSCPRKFRWFSKVRSDEPSIHPLPWRTLPGENNN